MLLYLLLFSKVLQQSISSNPLLKTLPDGEFSNLTFSATPVLYPKFSPVKY